MHKKLAPETGPTEKLTSPNVIKTELMWHSTPSSSIRKQANDIASLSVPSTDLLGSIPPDWREGGGPVKKTAFTTRLEIVPKGEQLTSSPPNSTTESVKVDNKSK